VHDLHDKSLDDLLFNTMLGNRDPDLSRICRAEIVCRFDALTRDAEAGRRIWQGDKTKQTTCECEHDTGSYVVCKNCLGRTMSDEAVEQLQAEVARLREALTRIGNECPTADGSDAARHIWEWVGAECESALGDSRA